MTMSHEMASFHAASALKQSRNEVAQRHGLPTIGTRMVNEHGIEWLVDGHSYVPDLTSLARDGGPVSQQDPRDLLPVIVPQNASQRLKDFWMSVHRCTSKYLVIVDTLPALRPHQAHEDGHWVDAWSDPDEILFFLDAAHVDESILAHEIAHVWIDLVEDCEDYRVLRDLSDTSRVRQLQYVQSFVLDRKVNEVLREHGFDLSIIEQHQHETILLLAQAVSAGYEPPYVREAATIALLVAATLLEQEEGLHDKCSLSPMLCYDGTVAGALRLLKQELPEIYALAEHLAACVQRHGYANRQAIGQAIDECLTAMFEFTGDPLDLEAELEGVLPTESYRDKWPELFPGWPVQAKLEVGKAMAKHKIGSEATWRVSYTFSGSAQIEFQEASGRWTPPVMLSHAPNLPPQFMPPRIERQRLRISRPPLLHRVTPKTPRVPTVPTPKVPPVSANPFPLQVPLQGLPNQAAPRFGRNYMPGVGRWLSRARLEEQMALQEHPYTYVQNNPINLRDPSGLAADPGGGPGTVRFSFDAFIPQKVVSFPGGISFAGDNRGFSGKGGTYRVQQNGIINLKTGRVTFFPKQPGTTRGLTGLGVRGYVATPTFVEDTAAIRDPKTGYYQVILNGAASDPRGRLGTRVNDTLNFAPALHFRIIIVFDRCGKVVSVHGDHTKFPAFELYTYQKGVSKLAWSYDPVKAGATATDIIHRVSF